MGLCKHGAYISYFAVAVIKIPRVRQFIDGGLVLFVFVWGLFCFIGGGARGQVAGARSWEITSSSKCMKQDAVPGSEVSLQLSKLTPVIYSLPQGSTS